MKKQRDLVPLNHDAIGRKTLARQSLQGKIVPNGLNWSFDLPEPMHRQF